MAPPLATFVARRRPLLSLPRHTDMEANETGGIVDVPDTPNMDFCETDRALAGKSFRTDSMLEVPDTPDRLVSSRASGSGANDQNAGVFNRLGGGHKQSSRVRGGQGLGIFPVGFDLSFRKEKDNFGVMNLDETHCGPSKLPDVNVRRYNTAATSSKDNLIQASSSYKRTFEATNPANCEVNKNTGNKRKKVMVSNGAAFNVHVECRNHKRADSSAGASSSDKDPLLYCFDSQTQFEGNNYQNGAPSVETNKLPSVSEDVVQSRVTGKRTRRLRVESSLKNSNVDLPCDIVSNDHGKSVLLDKNLRNGHPPAELGKKYTKRRLAKSGFNSPINIANELSAVEPNGNLNGNSNGSTSFFDDERAKLKGKRVISRNTSDAGGVVIDRRTSRDSPLPKLDELFAIGDLLRGSGTNASYSEHMSASSSTGMHARDSPLPKLDELFAIGDRLRGSGTNASYSEHMSASSSTGMHGPKRKGLFNGIHGVAESERSRREPRSQDGHPRYASSSSMAGEDFEIRGQNRPLHQTKRQCAASRKNSRMSSAFLSTRSSSARISSAPSCSESPCAVNSIIEIDEMGSPYGARCDRSHSNNSNVDVVEDRAVQIEADEELARRLQEEYNHEDYEADSNIALMLQHEENSRAGSNYMSHPLYNGMSRVTQNGRRTRNQSSSGRANSFRRATPARTGRPRRNLVLRGRNSTAPPIVMDGLFSNVPTYMSVEMGLGSLGAIETATMPFAYPLLSGQRDFNDGDYEMLLALDHGNHRSRGASIQQINSLPQSNVQAICDEACAVCLENPDKGDTIRHLPCLHKFHKDCIDPWLRQTPSCPVCKSGIS